MLTTRSSENSALWNLPPSDARQHFVLSGASRGGSELQKLLQHALPVESVAEQRIEDAYYDTSNFALFAQGYACCLRRMQNSAALCLIPVTAHGETDSLRASLVMNMPSTKGRKYLCIRDLNSGDIQSLLRSLLSEKKLHKQFCVSTRRQHYVFNESSRSLPLIVDSVKIKKNSKSDAGAANSIQYDEMILANEVADQEFTLRIQNKLKPQISLYSSKISAFRRALEMDENLLNKVREIKTSSIPSERSGHDLFRAHMQTQFAELQHWEPIAIDGRDEEGVHQMRVSIRRIRAALKTFAPLLAKSEITHWHTEFRWVAKRLGAVRDLDVFSEWLEQYKSSVDAQECRHLEVYQSDVSKLYQHARQGLLGGLSSDRYRSLVQEFSAWIEQEQCFFVNNDLTWKPTQELSSALTKRAVRRVNRKIKTVDKQSPAEELHRFRIECKRVRYSLDMLDGFVNKDHKPLIAKIKQIQEVLGEHQDACERSKRIRLYASGPNAGKHGQDFVFFLGALFAEQQSAIQKQANEFLKLQHSTKQTIKKTLKQGSASK